MTRLALIASALAVSLVAAASAQQGCAPISQVVSTLVADYDERPVSVMQTAQSEAMMFASESGSWTFVEIMPGGVGCIRGFGTGYEDVSSLVSGDPA